MIGHAKPFEESFLTQLHEVSTILPIPLGFFWDNKETYTTKTLVIQRLGTAQIGQ